MISMLINIEHLILICIRQWQKIVFSDLAIYS